MKVFRPPWMVQTSPGGDVCPRTLSEPLRLSAGRPPPSPPLHSCCWSLSVPARRAFRFCCRFCRSLACFEAGVNGGCLPSHAGPLTSSAGRRRNNETLERRATKPSITLSWVGRCCCSLLGRNSRKKRKYIYLFICSSP